MSGSRWVITPSWLSGSWRSFLYSSSVYCYHPFLISSASVRSIPFLSFIEPIFSWKAPLVTLIFLKISILSCSIVFLYFFALFTEEDFLISPFYSLELCIQLSISYLFSFPHFIVWGKSGPREREQLFSLSGALQGHSKVWLKLWFWVCDVTH